MLMCSSLAQSEHRNRRVTVQTLVPKVMRAVEAVPLACLLSIKKFQLQNFDANHYYKEHVGILL